jgi:hypothetical protein
MSKLEGRMLIMLEQIQTNQTSPVLTVSGLDLGSVRTRIIAQNLAYNDSVVSMDIARK